MLGHQLLDQTLLSIAKHMFRAPFWYFSPFFFSFSFKLGSIINFNLFKCNQNHSFRLERKDKSRGGKWTDLDRLKRVMSWIRVNSRRIKMGWIEYCSSHTQSNLTRFLPVIHITCTGFLTRPDWILKKNT